MSTETSGEWREERLFVLRAIDDLKAEQRRQIESEAVMRQTVVSKAEKDINAAHSRIRVLEDASKEQSKQSGILTIKNWVMAAVLSAGGVVTFELIKWVLTRK
jgi:hypothetical protein